MPDLDPQALLSQAQLLSDDVLDDLMAKGTAAYSAEVWAILEAESARRTAAMGRGDEVIIEEDPSLDASGPLTRIFSGTGNQVTLAKLILDGEQIAYVTTGEGVQDLFGVGRLFGGNNLITGPVHLAVRQGQAARAREALASLE